MNAQDIEHSLSLLGEWLDELEVRTTFRLLMIGGGFMLTQVGNRNFTRDVDVLVYDRGRLFATEDYRRFREATRFVGDETGHGASWYSDNISDFLEIAGPVPKGKLWRKFGRHLQVYIPPKEFILAHKLQAGRDKDKGDIAALLDGLGITTRKKAVKLIHKYIKNEDSRSRPQIQEILNHFFPE